METVSLFFILSLFLFSCGQASNFDDVTSHAEIDNQILRPQGPWILSRSLLYKDDPTITYCESAAGQGETYSGYRDLMPYPLASVSKIFLSAWALHQLGPDFRYQMIWKLKKISNDGTYDAYLQTNYDPIVNIEKILFALSQLNKSGVKRFRNLVIDETTRIYLSVLSNPHLELQDVPVTKDQTIENLNKILNSAHWGTQTEQAMKNLGGLLGNLLVDLQVPNEFSVQQISYLPQSKIDRNYYDKEIRIQSSSLLKYIKEINVYSNNYIADALFSSLGSAKAFEDFQLNQLKISKQELKIYTGSGLSLQTNDKRFDNLGNCLSVLKTLKYLDLIAQRNNLNLGHILLTAGIDQGTYESDLIFSRNIVLKTGRLYDVPTLNLAGISATNNGNSYFAVMAHNFENADENTVKRKRDDLISDLIHYQRAQSSFLTLQLDTLFFNRMNI